MKVLLARIAVGSVWALLIVGVGMFLFVPWWFLATEGNWFAVALVYGSIAFGFAADWGNRYLSPNATARRQALEGLTERGRR